MGSGAMIYIPSFIKIGSCFQKPLGEGVDIQTEWGSYNLTSLFQNKEGKLIKTIKISAKESPGYYELKKHKPWFDERCSELFDQRKQAKLQWLQDPSEINGDTLNDKRREARGHFRNKKENI
jgi:hypothetical protein